MKRSPYGFRLSLATCLIVCALTACGSSGSGGTGCVNTGDLRFTGMPTQLAFANVCVGESVTMSVSMQNVGVCGDVTVSGARLEGLGDEFTLSFTPVTLLPGQSAVASVTYAPRATPGSRSGNLVLDHDIVELGNQTLVPVAATDDGRADLVVTPNPIDFGDVAVGTFRDLDVVVKNIGCSAQALDAVALDVGGSPTFTLLNVALPAGGSMPMALDHNASIGLTMRYQPTECTLANSTLTITGTVVGSDLAWPCDVLGRGTACSSE